MESFVFVYQRSGDPGEAHILHAHSSRDKSKTRKENWSGKLTENFLKFYMLIF